MNDEEILEDVAARLDDLLDGVFADQPGLEVALPGGGQGEVVGGQPVKHGDGGFDVLANSEGLAVGDTGCGGAATQPPQQMPNSVASQQVLLLGVNAFGDGAIDPALESGHVLVSGRQGADRDQHAAQVLDGFARGQSVECVVGQRQAGQLAQDRWRGAVVEPTFHGAGTFRFGEGLVQGPQFWADLSGLVAEELVQASVDGAAGAPAGVDATGLPAVGAAVPEVSVWAGAGGAQRLVAGAAADPSDLPAPGAAAPALFAGTTPRFPSGFGDQTGGVASADAAGQCLSGPAVLAERSTPCSEDNRAAASALDAGLLVDHVGDQAVGTQRATPLVAGCGFSDGAAARAGLCPGLGHAVAAQPLPTSPSVQVNVAVAAGAGRANDHPGARVVKLVDQPQHGRQMGLRACSGEQLGPLCQCPGELIAPPHSGHRRGHRGDHHLP